MAKFKPKKLQRYTKIPRNSHRKYHVQDLNLIIKILFPKRYSTNKFESMVTEKTQFTNEQKKIVLQTAHSLCMINEMYRDEDSFGRLYICREDMINAIYLLQNELNLLNPENMFRPNVRWFYKRLKIHFPYPQDRFTIKETTRKFRCSKTNVQDKFNDLVDRDLLEIVGKKGLAFVYQLKEHPSEK